MTAFYIATSIVMVALSFADRRTPSRAGIAIFLGRWVGTNRPNFLCK